jgi:hypothetical protein
MKRTIAILAAGALAAGALATGARAAGSTTLAKPISFPNITVSNVPGGVDVTVAKGLQDIRTITIDTGTNITTDGPCAPIYVKVPRLQSVDVGGLTSVVEQTWYCVEPTGTFTFPYTPSFKIKTTNTYALRNLSIYTSLQGAVGEVLTNYVNEKVGILGLHVSNRVNNCVLALSNNIGVVGTTLTNYVDGCTNSFYSTYFGFSFAASNTSRATTGFCTNSADNVLNVVPSQATSFTFAMTNLEFHVAGIANCLGFTAVQTNVFVVYCNPSASDKTVKITLANTQAAYGGNNMTSNRYLHVWLYGAGGMKSYDINVVTNSQSGL